MTGPSTGPLTGPLTTLACGSLRARLAFVTVSVAVVGLVGPAQGHVPQAERVSKAVAEANVKAGRAQALRLELVMRIGDSDPIATGELITHPTGLARLELHGAQGLTERHLLQGIEHSASRGGQPVDRPRAFLPPLFFLQADSAVSLNAALTAFGIRANLIGLAACGESDCYVIGDPERVPPPLEPLYLEGMTRMGEADSEGEESVFAEGQRETLLGESAPGQEQADGEDGAEFLAQFAFGGGEDDPGSSDEDLGPASAIWVDTKTYDVKKIEVRDGVNIWFGPSAVFGKVRLPAWLVIDEPGQNSVRFDFRAATPVNASASAFGKSWLRAPEGLTPASSLAP